MDHQFALVEGGEGVGGGGGEGEGGVSMLCKLISTFMPWMLIMVMTEYLPSH